MSSDCLKYGSAASKRPWPARAWPTAEAALAAESESDNSFAAISKARRPIASASENRFRFAYSDERSERTGTSIALYGPKILSNTSSASRYESSASRYRPRLVDIAASVIRAEAFVPRHSSPASHSVRACWIIRSACLHLPLEQSTTPRSAYSAISSAPRFPKSCLQIAIARRKHCSAFEYFPRCRSTVPNVLSMLTRARSVLLDVVSTMVIALIHSDSDSAYRPWKL